MEIIDRERLQLEVVEMFLSHGLSEPWLMEVVRRFIMDIGDEQGLVNMCYGVNSGCEFISFDFGLLNNVFCVEYPFLVYYGVSNITNRVEEVFKIDMEVSLKKGEFSKEISRILLYLDVQMRVESSLEQGLGLDDLDKLLQELL